MTNVTAPIPAGGDYHITRSATYVIAASDAPAHVKAQADYVCDGTADEADIYAALGAITSGGLIQLSPGIFHISSPLNIDKPSVTIQGVTPWVGSSMSATWKSCLKLVDNANCNVLNVQDAGLKFCLRYMAIIGNKDNQAAGDYDGIWTGTANHLDLHLDTVYVMYCKRYGINMRGGNSAFRHVYSEYNGNSGIAISGGDNNVLTDCSSWADGYRGFELIGDRNTLVAPRVYDAADTGIVDDGQNNVIIGPMIWSCGQHGIYLRSNDYATVQGGQIIDCGDSAPNTYDGIRINAGSTYNNISGVIIKGSLLKYAINEVLGASNNVIIGNTLADGTTAKAVISSSTVCTNNQGYIAPGEVRTASGSLVPTGTCTATTVTGTFTESPMSLKPGANTLHCTASGTLSVVIPTGSTAVVTSGDATVTDSPKSLAAGTTVVTVATGAGADDFTITVTPMAFTWHNPEAQDIYIKKVVIPRTAAGGTATSIIDVGIADDAIGTNAGVEFFDNLDANAAAAVHDSWVAGDGGTQAKWVLCQDSASATDGWIVGQIKTEIANSLAGSYYIEYVGK